MSTAKFYLYHHWWRGQFVIRGQAISHYDLRLDEGKPSHRYFNLDKDPTYYTKGIVAVEKKCEDKRWLTFEGIIKPKGEEDREWLIPGNPNKKIVAHVDRIDEGKVNIIEDSPTFISYMFHGKELNGYWVMRKSTPEENVWTFGKSTLPKTLEGQDLENLRNLQRIHTDKIEKIIQLSKEGKSRPEIAKTTGCSKTTVWNYQKEHGLV